MANGHFQSRPKFYTIGTINIVQASNACLDNNTVDYYQFWREVSNIRSRWVLQTNLDLSIAQFN